MPNYIELQATIAMITEDKNYGFVLYGRCFLLVSWLYDGEIYGSDNKRRYHRNSTLSKAVIILIMKLLHNSGYRCLKRFNFEKVGTPLRHLFPRVVSYNRFVELEKEVAVPLALFIKKVLFGTCTGISFVDSTLLRVWRNQRIQRKEASSLNGMSLTACLSRC